MQFSSLLKKTRSGLKPRTDLKQGSFKKHCAKKIMNDPNIVETLII